MQHNKENALALLLKFFPYIKLTILLILQVLNL